MPDHPLEWSAFTELASGWAMLGNGPDPANQTAGVPELGVGDCVSVTAANYRRVMTHLAGAEVYPDLAQVVEFYKTQNPNFPSQDDGMDIQTALECLHAHGDKYFDGVKPIAFAKVDPTDVEQCEAAIAIFGGLWTGVLVTDANMRQFDAGEDWDVASGARIEGGHSIITGAYTGQDSLGFVTWAEVTEFTKEFWLANVEEAWVVVWPENLGTRQFQQGVDHEALVTAYHDLTGKTLPVPPDPAPQPEPTPPAPGPEPAPEPSPTPAPTDQDPDDVKLASAAYEWLQHGHSGVNRIFATKVAGWLDAKGFWD
jgi:hypothetical protein